MLLEFSTARLEWGRRSEFRLRCLGTRYRGSCIFAEFSQRKTKTKTLLLENEQTAVVAGTSGKIERSRRLLVKFRGSQQLHVDFCSRGQTSNPHSLQGSTVHLLHDSWNHLTSLCLLLNRSLIDIQSTNIFCMLQVVYAVFL